MSADGGPSPKKSPKHSLRVVIDGHDVEGRDGETILELARREQIYVPTLCFDPRLSPYGACRVCLVGVRGARGPMASCTTRLREGMVIDTREPTALRVAKGVVELVLGDYPKDALARPGTRNELREVAAHLGVRESRFGGAPPSIARDDRHPYLSMKLDECIVCGRCVRACEEVQGAFALSYAGRGYGTRIVAGLDAGLLDSSCVSCGACASSCPTGAIDERAYRTDETVEKVVTTTCAYCGVGCSLDVNVRGGEVISIDPTLEGPSNRGHTCVKGRFAHAYGRSRDRVTSPLLRTTDGGWREASWDEALGFVAERLRRIVDEHGPSAVAAISSSRCTNEENYLLQKTFRAALGTNNIDNCSRVCHSPTSMGLIRSFGESGGTNSYEDIDLAKLLVVTGANATEGHPVVGARLKEAVLRGAKLIVIDPRRIELATYADVFLQLRPGTNVAVYNGLAHVIVRDGLYDRAFVDARAEQFDAYREHIARYTPEHVEAVSGVPAREIERAAHLYATTRPGGIFYGLGVTEQRQGVSGVRTIANLAILTGNLGVRGGGTNPLRGQNNVQGSSDVGALPTYFTMYRSVADAAVRGEFERAWGRTLPDRPGLTIPAMFEQAIAGSLRAMYVFGEDIAQTDPNVGHVEKALRSLELLVVHDLFENVTAKLAHVVLPGSTFLEKTGTFTNAERRVQLVRAAVAPPGHARPDLDILLELSKRLGYEMPHRDAAEVWDEIARLTPQLRGISHARLEGGGLQWPVLDATHPGTPVLFTERFQTASGRAVLFPVDWEKPGEEADDAFPFVLITGRQLAHYNSGTQTRRTANVELQPEDFVELHPDDAAELGIEQGDLVEIASRRGAIEAHACVTRRVARGNVFLAFHFPEVKTNVLTSGSSEPETRCPEYKVTAVRVTRVPGTHRVPRPAAKGFRQDAYD
ncbi:MAG: formate dehydrogenase subunit alpha [Sandaracinaceae bacterium]|nr:formate dehydrogenase subunit alpha [Sandaracinaceae bacterium]